MNKKQSKHCKYCYSYIHADSLLQKVKVKAEFVN